MFGVTKGVSKLPFKNGSVQTVPHSTVSKIPSLSSSKSAASRIPSLSKSDTAETTTVTSVVLQLLGLARSQIV